jgi:hypothetical protein
VKKGRGKEWADYYDQVNIRDELLEGAFQFSLEEKLRRDILSNGFWSEGFHFGTAHKNRQLSKK